jgi:hypothetical protein
MILLYIIPSVGSSGHFPSVGVLGHFPSVGVLSHFPSVGSFSTGGGSCCTAEFDAAPQKSVPDSFQKVPILTRIRPNVKSQIVSYCNKVSIGHPSVFCDCAENRLALATIG